jgi:hypothetical protein
MPHQFKTALVFTVSKGENIKKSGRAIQSASDFGVMYNVDWQRIRGNKIPVAVLAPNGQEAFLKSYKKIKETVGIKNPSGRLFSHVETQANH